MQRRSKCYITVDCLHATVPVELMVVVVVVMVTVSK